jgi:hypothetical protein
MNIASDLSIRLLMQLSGAFRQVLQEQNPSDSIENIVKVQT